MGFVYNSVICPILHVNFIAMLLTIRCKRKNESSTLSEFYCFTMYILTWFQESFRWSLLLSVEYCPMSWRLISWSLLQFSSTFYLFLSLSLSLFLFLRLFFTQGVFILLDLCCLFLPVCYNKCSPLFPIAWDLTLGLVWLNSVLYFPKW